jgi:5'-3' exonuclease
MSNKPLILVDTSYTSFYRFFATMRWYSFSYPDEYKEYKANSSYDWNTNKIFIEKYEKMYLESIISLVGKKQFNESNIIFCMDTPKKDLWRTELYCDYKGDRADLSKKHDFKNVFDYTYDTIIPNIITKYKNIFKMRVPKIEGDDVIAIITIHLKDTDKMITIISGDNDFLQLGRKTVNFINYKKKEIINITEDMAKLALVEKIVLGDMSDCIPSIFKARSRINKKELIESKEKLIEYLKSNEDAMKQYKLNETIIDFNNIPKKYYKKVVKEYMNLFEIKV